MAVSPELARIYVSAPADDEMLETLEITHPLFSTPSFYITNYYEIFSAKPDPTLPEVIFTPAPFSVRLPASGEGGFEDLTLVISNVSRVFVDEIEKAIANPTVGISFTYRAYAKSIKSAPGFQLPKLTSSEVVVDAESISARASFADLMNREYPKQLYTTDLFPMLGDQS